MRARLLSPSEWGKLHTEGIPQVATVMSNEGVKVVGVEVDGEIVACATIFEATHWEGTWIKPEFRNAGVTRALLRGAREAAAELGRTWVYTGSDGKHVESIIERLGGVPLDMKTYVMPLERRKESVCLQP